MAGMSFRDELTRSQINLLRANLRFAREISYPTLDLEHYVDRVERLALSAREAIPDEGEMSERAVALSRYLFQDLGFRGNRDDFADPRNSFLNEVLDRQLGLPISLTVLYVEVARRMEIPAAGVGLPGHFIARVGSDSDLVLLDPFNSGRTLKRDDCIQLVRRTTRYKGPFQQAWLAPVGPHNILARMLNNLKFVYVGREAWEEAIAALDRLRLVQPDRGEHLRDLGILHFRRGSAHHAAHFLDSYLRNTLDAPDAELVKDSLGQLLEKLARIN